MQSCGFSPWINGLNPLKFMFALFDFIMQSITLTFDICFDLLIRPREVGACWLLNYSKHLHQRLHKLLISAIVNHLGDTLIIILRLTFLEALILFVVIWISKGWSWTVMQTFPQLKICHLRDICMSLEWHRPHFH